MCLTAAHYCQTTANHTETIQIDEKRTVTYRLVTNYRINTMGVGHNGLTEDLQSPLQFILQVSELPRQHFPAVFFKEIWTIFMLKPIH